MGRGGGGGRSLTCYMYERKHKRGWDGLGMGLRGSEVFFLYIVSNINDECYDTT